MGAALNLLLLSGKELDGRSDGLAAVSSSWSFALNAVPGSVSWEPNWRGEVGNGWYPWPVGVEEAVSNSTNLSTFELELWFWAPKKPLFLLSLWLKF